MNFHVESHSSTVQVMRLDNRVLLLARSLGFDSPEHSIHVYGTQGPRARSRIRSRPTGSILIPRDSPPTPPRGASSSPLSPTIHTSYLPYHHVPGNDIVLVLREHSLSSLMGSPLSSSHLCLNWNEQ